MLYSGIRFPYTSIVVASYCLLHYLSPLSPYTLRAGNTNYHYATVSEKLKPVSNNFHTLEPNTSSLENQPQYEVPIPQQWNVNSTLETSDIPYEMGEMKVSETL